MRKLLFLIVAFLFSLTMYAQIGLGMTESRIRSAIKSTETTETEILDNGTRVLHVDNGYYIRSYFFLAGKCELYTVLPKTTEACDLFLGICNDRYNKVSDGYWTTMANGIKVIVAMRFNEDLEEHVYYFVADDDEDDESSTQRYGRNM